jgi:hypothetical protein
MQDITLVDDLIRVVHALLEVHSPQLTIDDTRAALLPLLDGENVPERRYSTKEAAVRACRTPMTIQRWVESGRLKPENPGGSGGYVFRESELDRAIRCGKRSTGRAGNT